MDGRVVIARAYRGEPLRRVAIERRGSLIYIANPESLPDVNSGRSFPVGFPAGDVFGFDEGIYDELHRQWQTGGRTESASWEKLTLAYIPASRG